VHQTLVYSVGAVFAVIAYSNSEAAPTPQVDMLVLILLQLLVLVSGYYVIDQYQIFYTIGTYIALKYETRAGISWLKMARQFNKYRSGHSGSSAARLPFALGGRWGTDPCLAGYILLTILTVSLAAAAMQIDSLCSVADQYPVKFVANLLLLCVNTVPVFYLIFKFDRYREHIELDWQRFVTDYQTGAFTDRYESKG
jgi:hypothetical protein